MANYTTVETGTTEVDDSLVLAFDAGFMVAAEQQNVMEEFVQYKADIGAVSIKFPKYATLSPATTPLAEKDDVTSDAMSDTGVIFTPAEYGKVITRTSLASLQTGGKVDIAAARLVGNNVGRTKNVLAIQALEATSNVIIAGAGSDAALGAGDVMSSTLLNKVYNKLARASIPMFQFNAYAAFMHDDVIADLRAGANAGDWTDVVKYALPEQALRNEVGMYKGFRIIRNNDCSFADQTGSGTVDVYKSSFIGFNGLGMAESKPAGVVLTMTDKLNRFLNVGWYGVMQYGIVDTDAVWQLHTASSLGANAS